MSERRVTIQQIASRAECSTGVVSAVLNEAKGNIRVSSETRRRVLSAARELGFRRTIRQYRIGIVASEAAGRGSVGYSQAFTSLVTQAALRRHLGVEILTLAELDGVWERGLDGVIGISCGAPLLPLREVPNLPLLALNRPMLEDGIHSIYCNHFEQGYQATKHFLEHGHRHIGLFVASHDSWGCGERCRGYEAALEECGMALDPGLVRDTSRDNTCDVLENWHRHGVTAILNAHPQQLLDVLHILGNVMRLRIGTDISTITVDDVPVFGYFTPPQTVIHQPLGKMADAAIEKMLGLLARPPEAPPAPLIDIEFPCELIPRGSVVVHGQSIPGRTT